MTHSRKSLVIESDIRHLQEYHRESYYLFVARRWMYCYPSLYSCYPAEPPSDSETLCFLCTKPIPSSVHEWIHNGKKRKPIGRCCLLRYLPSATSDTLTATPLSPSDTPTPALRVLFPWMKEKQD